MSQCRSHITKLIHEENPNHVIFTLNTTDALNLAIRGIVRLGDHVINTWLEHNSVLRPYNALVNYLDVDQS